MIRAILWDNDGVLVDTERLYYQANREVFESVGCELTLEEYVDVSLAQGRSVFDLLSAATEAERERLRARRNERYEALLVGGIQVLDGVRECLTELHGRVPMAIVTSSNAHHFDVTHSQTDLLQFFEFVLKAGDYRHHKPHPEPFLTAAERLELEPGECLVIEDTQRGLEAATRAGMRCLAIPQALSSGGDFSDAHAVLGSVREVPTALGGLLGKS